MQRVAEEASLTLEKVLARPPDLPAHWRPIHGDYVPWNVREDDRGELWLLDWEDAGWGPPLTDLVRYVVAYHSLGWSSPERIAGIVKTTVGQTESVETLIEVATFWLSHANLQLGDTAESVPRRKAKDSTRAAREVAAFRVLAFGAQHLLGAAEGLRDGA